MKINFSIACILTFTSLTVRAQSRPKADPADAVLDRLERKLIEQEAKTLRLQPPPVREGTLGGMRLDLPASPASTILAPLPQQQDFAAIDQDLLSLEQEVDDLAGQVEKLKADFQSHAGKGSFVEIIAELEAPQETSLRDLTFSINGHKIYSRNSQGPWIPGAQILLYSGPLEAGEHTLILEARTVRRYGEGLPLDQNLYHQYQQTFPITIPSGMVRKGYRLKLAKPEQQNIHAKAVFENYDLK